MLLTPLNWERELLMDRRNKLMPFYPRNPVAGWPEKIGKLSKT
jgi:hypothetical protein